MEQEIVSKEFLEKFGQDMWLQTFDLLLMTKKKLR